MRRGRAGALPAAIGALCRALPPGSRPAPETFRLAKFDRPQASLQIWWLLYSLLKQIHNRGRLEPDTIGTQIKFVKAVLWYYGYGRPEFYQLPSDGSQGSRELLLAFSWLLNRINLLEQLLTVNRVKVGDEAFVCMCEDTLSNSWVGRTETVPEPSVNGEADVRYLQWLNGRLRFQWRSLHIDHQEQCKLLHKIHSYTSGSRMDQTIGHFSVIETDLVRQPESYKQLLQLLESETSRLEAFLEWKQLEPVYWHWMVKLGANKLPDEREFCATVRTITEAVELKLADLKYHCAPQKNGAHGPYRLVFSTQHSAKKTSRPRPVLDEPISQALHATEVISDLRRKEAALERELMQLQEEYRQKLDEIAEGLVGVICIPPMKR
ncbi:tubulin epsilon and delta complex protein 1 isoform X3 [Carettochelys insculpta]|uniref:tubulin epsilon and delta complex protein 1 isoform X3 n=1 Tax=Carettochelys insculpta TaxID=44489 RepID=UPI003EBD4A0C